MSRRIFLISTLLLVSLPPVFGQPPSNSQIHPGIVVEKVAKYSESERAGLQEGDILLTWVCRDLTGKLESPFDLSRTEMVQAPRGTVTLEGFRGTENRSWTLGPDDWGIKPRPNFQGSLLALYREGQKLFDSGKLTEAAERWWAAASQAQNSGVSSSWLSPWLLSSAAELLEEGKQYSESDNAYQEAVKNAAGADPTVQAQILHAWADSFRKRSDWENADKYYQQAIAEGQKAGAENPIVALSLYNLGLVSFKRGDLAKAEEYHGRALALEEKLAPGGLRLARNLNGLGDVADDRGDLAKAEEYQRKAMIIQEKLAPNGLGAAQSFKGFGDLAYDRGNLTLAGKYYSQSLFIREKISPGSLEVASSLNGLGLVAYQRDDLSKAEEYHRQALAIREKLAPDSLEVATSLNNLAIVARYRGDYATSEEYQLRDLAIEEQLAPGSIGVARSLTNLGSIAYRRGDLAKAEEYDRRALVILEKLAPASIGVARNLTNLGAISQDRGDLSQAEDYYRQGLAIREKLAPGSLDVANSLSYLGMIASARGDLDRADDYFRRALTIKERLVPDGPDVATTLNNLGFAALARGDLPRAEEYFQRAVTICRRIAPGTLDMGHYLNNLGWVARGRGDLAKAEDYEREALAIRQKIVPGSLLVAWSLNSLADVAQDRGDLAQAEDGYRRALAIREKLAPGSKEHAETLAALAGIMRKRQQPEAAAQLYEQALNTLESQTARLGGSGDVRSGFRARHADYYRNYIDLLIAQKKPQLAFEVLERSRARALLELMAAANMNIRQGVDAGLLATERLLQKSIRAKSDRRLQLLNGKHTEDQLAALDREIKGLLGQYGELEGQIQENSPDYAALTQPQPLSARAAQEQVLDNDSVLLEYSLGVERSYLFAMSSTTLQTYELPKRTEIEKSARLVYSLLTARSHSVKGETELQRRARLRQAQSELPQAAAELSRMLLLPAASELRAKRLLIVGDGALAYIPFAMLPVPATNVSRQPVPLIGEHEIVTLPSASVVAALRKQEMKRKPPTRAVAVLADPVFTGDDSRVVHRHGQAGREDNEKRDASPARATDLLVRSVGDVGLERDGEFRLYRLPFTRQEAEAIAAVTSPGQSMQALDFQASRETATSSTLAQYRIVHFATHGLLDSQNPELSGLVLSLVDKQGRRQDGFLALQDIYNLHLTADLVVLSACETGLGKEIDGEGLVGLARGFMYAGASRVVASLWNVSDLAAAELMGYFYKAMERQGMRPSAALRAAQLEMWKRQRWSDPYYWAAFQIQGDWN